MHNFRRQKTYLQNSNYKTRCKTNLRPISSRQHLKLLLVRLKKNVVITQKLERA